MLKEWKSAEIESLDVEETANGQAPSDDFDGDWVQINGNWYRPGNASRICLITISKKLEKEELEMKKWMTPEIEALEVSETANGQAPDPSYDDVWTQIDGQWYLQEMAQLLNKDRITVICKSIFKKIS